MVNPLSALPTLPSEPHLHGLSVRSQFVVTFSYNHFSRCKSSFYYHIILEFRSKFDKTLFYSRVTAHYENIGSTLFYNQ